MYSNQNNVFHAQLMSNEDGAQTRLQKENITLVSEAISAQPVCSAVELVNVDQDNTVPEHEPNAGVGASMRQCQL